MSTDGSFRVGPADDPDRYLLGPAVASGAEGILYRGAIRTPDGWELAVAVKMLQPGHLPRLPEWHERWREQVELLRSLQFPGIVRVRDGFVGPLPHVAGQAGESQTLYLVMNWIEGEPLDEWLRRQSERDPLDNLKVLLPVAAALDVMHSGRATGGVPLAHRDVKPSNIIVTEEGGVLVDFGLTRGLPGGQRLSGVSGTEGYRAPEVTEAGVYSAASDRYAFGGVAFFVLTGTDPPPTHRPELLRARLTAVPALQGRLDVVDRVLSMLADDPRARPEALANWLGQLRNSSLADLPGTLRPVAPARPARSGEGPGARNRIDTEDQRTAPSWRWLVPVALGLTIVVGVAAAAIAARVSGGKGPSDGGGVTARRLEPTTTAVPPIVVTELLPTADSYANEGAPASNFGSSASLSCRGTIGAVCYLRFSLPPAPPGKKLTSAALRIHTTHLDSAGSADPYSVWLSSDSWMESDLNWNNRPPLTPVVIGVIEARDPDTAYETKLNASELEVLLGSSGTLAVTSTRREMNDNLQFWSREFEVDEYRPHLLLTFS